jgi:type VI secretion system secreted protein Hcp
MALFDAFLKLDGIKGESADAKHKGEIDISSFSWGLSQTGVQATGGGGGAGKVKAFDFAFVKKTDAASPLLMLNCASGAHIPTATFVVRKAGGEQLEYLKIKLTDVLVSSYKPHGSALPGASGPSAPAVADDWQAAAPSATEDQVPYEHFSINFAKIEYQYQPQGADGKAQGGPVIAGWDVKANQKV